MEVKKYGNRRLYDTGGSRYVTLEEVAERVRLGEDLRVVDAKTGLDLTQVTLAQLILESRGAARLLPVPLLKQLLRMRDDALAEFFGRYVTWALEVYLRLKQGARSVWNPFAGLGLGAPRPAHPPAARQPRRGAPGPAAALPRRAPGQQRPRRARRAAPRDGRAQARDARRPSPGGARPGEKARPEAEGEAPTPRPLIVLCTAQSFGVDALHRVLRARRRG